MLEARRRHRQLRAAPPGAAAARRCAKSGSPTVAIERAENRALAGGGRIHGPRALQLVAMVALSQLGYRVALWQASQVPASALVAGMLVSALSGGVVPARVFEKAVAVLTRYLPRPACLRREGSGSSRTTRPATGEPSRNVGGLLRLAQVRGGRCARGA